MWSCMDLMNIMEIDKAKYSKSVVSSFLETIKVMVKKSRLFLQYSHSQYKKKR